MTLETAIEQLRNAMAKHGRCGRLVARPGASVPGELPNPLREFYTRANPDDVAIPWVAETLRLHSVENLDDAQAGYRHSANGPHRPEPGWQPNWLVIGDALADPIICDTNSPDAAIYMAMHGVGSWSPARVSRSLAEFLDVLSRWLSLVTSNDGALRAEDGALAPKIVKSIDDVLAGLTPSDRTNFMGFIG